MIHGSIKKFTEGVKFFTEVSDSSWREFSNSRRYQIIHGGVQIIHGGIKKFTEGVTYFTEV